MNPTTPDPADLSRLHDIVLPSTPYWWPPAVGWFVLMGIVCLLLMLSTAGLAAWWWKSRYRRAALAELKQIEAATDRTQALPQLAALVKRTALSVYPREQIAELSGEAWLQYLDASAAMTSFTRGAGRQLESGYERGEQLPTSELIVAVRHWIQHHQADYSC